MTSKILFDVKVEEGADKWYGQMTLSNIRYEDGSSVSVQKFLGIVFKSPAAVAAMWYSVSPYVSIKAEMTNQAIDGSTFKVTAKLTVDKAFTFKPSDIFHFGINGDLTQNPKRYTESFVLAADQIPSGTVNIHVPSAPDQALEGYQQKLAFNEGSIANSITAPLDKTTSINLVVGTYTVAAAELATTEQTVVARTQVSPSSITVVTGESTDVNRYSAIDVIIGNIQPLKDEELHVIVTNQGTRDVYSPINNTTPLRRLPPSGTCEASIDPITLNNVQYSFDPKSQSVSASLYKFVFSPDDLHETPIHTTGFVKLPIEVKTDLAVPDASIAVRLSSPSMIYKQTVQAQAGTTPFAVLVAPGQYTVQAPGFIKDGIVYVVVTPATLTVESAGTTILQLKLQLGANLNVRGFPSFLSFGGCADMTANNQADFVAARASSVFKYAGDNGAGDAGGYLDKDDATKKTIELARAVEQELGDGNPVLPVMISYTCDLSGGNSEPNLQDEKKLAHSFGNLILSLKIAQGAKDEHHPVSAGYIVNPDFISDGQQKKRSPDYVMPVHGPLQTALGYRKVVAKIPDYITDTLRGYVRAVNWLVRTVAPAVTFGWQVKLWGFEGGSAWVYTDKDVAEFARQTADYTTSLGVFEGDNPPDFLAVDRYEGDDLTDRGYPLHYCYGPREWGRFFNFVSALSAELQVPLMPWQIPSSRTPLVTDLVFDDFHKLQHWGTGGSYMLGDADINSDYHNVNHKILAIKFLKEFSDMGKTAEEMFKRSEPFDLTTPAYGDFPLRGIFSVLLGGGSTTGIVSSIGNPEPWVRNKLNAYMKKPIRFSK
ncbi:hypothetical protein V8E54_004756 [Elaphomyces granulatus]